MASSASLLVAPARVVEPVNPSTSSSRRSGAGVAVALSLLIHLGLALLAVRHFREAAVRPEPRDEPIEMLTVDLEPPTPERDLQPQNSEPSPVQRVSTAATRAVAQGTPVAKALSAKLTPAEPATKTSESESIPVASGAPESSTPRFTLTVSKVAGSSTSANTAISSGIGSNSTLPGGPAGAPLSSANVDVPAKLRAGNVPAYTPAALAAGIEANVPLEIVISEAGLVLSAHGLEHVGYGLDEAARQSVLGYRFSPAMRNSRPVSVRMRWLMRFQLR